ncbi:MAG: molybdenum cofactor guanylyltransferase [Deltaproteobacteria bacterium]|nr:molybdenum cofactor guanylyltransferase [Deltaproteobacteria bacterium]
MTSLPTGVVLAGGASRRLGQDKALYPFRGGTLADWAAERLAEVCGEVVVADRGRKLLLELESVVDGPGQGPAAGLLGAALARPGRDLLVLACDLPRVPVALLRDLAERSSGQAWVPRHGGRLEPLCARFSASSLVLLDAQVASGELALHSWLRSQRLEVGFLEGEELLRHGNPKDLFFNLNRPEDLRRFETEGAATEPLDLPRKPTE